MYMSDSDYWLKNNYVLMIDISNESIRNKTVWAPMGEYKIIYKWNELYYTEE